MSEEIKGIGLRKKLYYYKLLMMLFWATVVVIVASTAIVFFVEPDPTREPQPKYIIYFIVLIGSGYLVSEKARRLKYLPCPYCNKSILIKDAWKCNYCHNRQTKENYLSESCEHCEREIKTAFCEHCDEEFNL